MHKKLLILLLLHLSIAYCQPLRAQWWTGWSRQTSLALCLHLEGDSNVQLFSPLQSQAPLTVSQWSLRGDTLRIECKNIGFRTTLERKGNQWQGTWRQGLMREKITFLPADTLYQLQRPQTPLPPYRFEEETIVADYIDSRGDSIHLEGTLSIPRGSGPFPTLILVSGSGQHNRDEEILFHRPFLVLADYLAAHGIAVLRYDDRGVGASSGPLDSATIHSFSEDTEAMLHAALTNRHVDPNRLGIGGHSEGGAIAPMVAARNKNAKFVVMLAGPGVTGRELLVQQNEALFLAQGVSQNLSRLRAQCIDALIALPKESSVKDYQSVILQHTQDLSPEQIDSIGLKKGSAYSMKQLLETPWMQAFLLLNPADYLPSVHVPILALQGAKDSQVLAGPNLQGIRRLTGSRAETFLLQDLNHLFQHCLSGDAAEYVQIEETFAPQAMEKIVQFIQKLSQ